MIARNAIMGEISIPNLKPTGNAFLMVWSTGSVDLYKNCTMGLKGSGFTQLINALIRISQYKTVRTTSKMWAEATIRLARINILVCLKLLAPQLQKIKVGG
jgi:hypothetical protein